MAYQGPPPQGAYPQPGGFPPQGAYPQPGGFPPQGAYPPPGAYPAQGQLYAPGPAFHAYPLESDKSSAAATLLAMFLGVLGVHRFYTGRVISGLFQLITFGGFGIWLFVDMILLLTGSFTDAQGRRLAYRHVPMGEKDWKVAALLVFFLGTLGIHRFYVGRGLSGFFQLITFGGFGIWTLVDLIVIVCGDFKDGRGQLLLRP